MQKQNSVTKFMTLMISTLKICGRILAQKNNVDDDSPRIRNLVALEKGVVYTRNILVSAINRAENYFGSHNEAILQAESESVQTYLSSLSEMDLSSDICPLLPYYVRSRQHGVALTYSDASILENIEAVEDLSGRLFWVSSFGMTESITWQTYSTKFVEKYGEIPEERLDEMRVAMVVPSEGSNHPDGVFRGTLDNDAVKHSVITLERFRQFLKGSHGVFDAFMRVSDPGTVVLCAGLVDDAPSNAPAASSIGVAGRMTQPIGVGEDTYAAHYAPTIVKGLLGQHIVQLACGGQHVAVLSATGRVFTWGRGGFGRLGHGHSGAVESPTLVEGLKNVQVSLVCCGFAYTAAVDSDGKVYTWGAGENGRLGHGDASDRISPTVVAGMRQHKVASVYAGSVHTCMLTSDGMLFACGKCEYTGHGRQIDVLYPEELDYFDGVPIKTASVGPGGYHTIALTTLGDVYTWGHNRVGQLGHLNTKCLPRNSDGAYYVPKPLKIPKLPESILEVVAGWGHTGVIGESGKLYMCGRNVQGQLGIGEPRFCPTNERGHFYQPEFKEVPHITNTFRSVKQIACGGEHTAILFNDNDVATTGSGAKGQLCHGTCINTSTPKNIVSIKESGRAVKHIACGNYCTLILAGRFQPIPLRRLCAETVRGCSELFRALELSGGSSPPTGSADSHSSDADECPAPYVNSVHSWEALQRIDEKEWQSLRKRQKGGRWDAEIGYRNRLHDDGNPAPPMVDAGRTHVPMDWNWVSLSESESVDLDASVASMNPTGEYAMPICSSSTRDKRDTDGITENECSQAEIHTDAGADTDTDIGLKPINSFDRKVDDVSENASGHGEYSPMGIYLGDQMLEFIRQQDPIKYAKIPRRK
jgi:hypothetical protein